MDLVAVAREFGAPLTILAVVLLGLWRVLRWTATNIVEPVVTAHLGLIEGLKQSASQQVVAITKLCDLQEQIADDVRALRPRWLRSPTDATGQWESPTLGNSNVAA